MPTVLFMDTENKFAELFNQKTGLYVRTGVIEKGVDTGVNAFMRVFPALLDIGVAGFCKNAHLCKVGCYQGGKTKGDHMPLENYKSIIDQCKGKVFQVALGGAGSPDEIPYFEDILRYTRENAIIPNYTTSGIDVDDKTAQLTKEYCGSVAVSWYSSHDRHPVCIEPTEYTDRALRLYLAKECKTNIHLVLSQHTIVPVMNMLSNKYFERYEGLNAIVFLLHKPVGKGSFDNVLDTTDGGNIEEFCRLALTKHPFKIGFDSCSVPMLLNYAKDLNKDVLDTCEGGRFSAYISPSMIMTPCSFDQQFSYGVDLNSYTIAEAWNSSEFSSFREKLKGRCVGCSDYIDCMGGCPLVPAIRVCDRKEKLE